MHISYIFNRFLLLWIQKKNNLVVNVNLNAQCGTYLVGKISKLTRSAKQISGAIVTNTFQACFSVPDSAKHLSFRNQNAYN